MAASTQAAEFHVVMPGSVGECFRSFIGLLVNMVRMNPVVGTLFVLMIIGGVAAMLSGTDTKRRRR